jgi:hypothetical protein
MLGDFTYENSRKAWIKVRVQALNSPPRVLEIRKPQFPPDYRHGDGSRSKYKPGTYSPEGRRIGDAAKEADEQKKTTSAAPSFWWATNTAGKKKPQHAELEEDQSKGENGTEKRT